MRIIQNRKIYFTFSSLLVALSAVSLFVFGLRLGIDFVGGSLLEVQFYEEEVSAEKIQATLSDLHLEDFSVLPTDQGTWILRMKEINEDTHQQILNTLFPPDQKSEQGEEKDLSIEQIEGDEPIGVQVNVADEKQSTIGQELRFDSIGPVIGQELKTKSVYALLVALVAIVLYIAWAFRKVSRPVSSWKYGLAASIALFHDVFITVGLFSVFGYFFKVEINTSFVAALLTILGYSINDTIVVFDRIRENIKTISSHSFENVVNESVNQVMSRSINTSFTTILALLSLYFFGGETIRYFVLALIFGISIGTYSSIFLASPLLVHLEKRQ